MYFDFITPDQAFGGFCAESARGGPVRVVARELVTSTDDGPLLEERLTAVSESILGNAPQRLNESCINHFLVIVHRGGRTQVWVNEPLTMVTRTKREVKAGDPATVDELADILDVDPGVSVPNAAGYLFMFSYGWHRALYFDLRALHDAAPSVTAPRALGRAYAYFLNRIRFPLMEEDWQRLREQCWFPFTSLPERLLQRMVRQVQAEWSVDELLPDITETVRTITIPQQLAPMLAHSSLLERHRMLIQQSLDAFQQGKWAIAAQALIPKIEGILREHHAVLGRPKTNSTAQLLSSAEERAPHSASMLMPDRLRQFVTDVFFAYEDFGDPKAVSKATRHAAGHGVAGDAILDEKRAVLAILTLYQLVVLMDGALERTP